MATLFLKLINMSVAATWLTAAILLIRPLMKRAPRWISLILWLVVALRLIVPYSPESSLSLLPSSETVPEEIIYSETPYIHTGFEHFNYVVSSWMTDTLAPPEAPSGTVEDTVIPTPMERVVDTASVIWIAGAAVMVGYCLFSYLKLRRSLSESVPMDNGTYLCDGIATPFVLGIIFPKVYVPSDIPEKDLPYVIAHERAHIKRLDHLWKPLGFLLLSIHWFNPVMWVAYVLFCRDIEYACDEKVIATLGKDAKKPYSMALIDCSASRRIISACPVAFGERDVEKRVRSVLSYKRPTLWIIIAALVVSAAIGVGFLTNPPEDPADVPGDSAPVTDEVIEEIPEESNLVIFTLENSYDPISPAKVTLNLDDGTFVFFTSALDSNHITGTYTIGSRLILMVDGDKKNGVYTFDIIDENRIAFIDSLSTNTPSYKFEKNGEVLPTVPDGGEFVSSKNIFYIYPDGTGPFYKYIRSDGDVDGDGIVEKCYLSIHPHSGAYGYSLGLDIYEGEEKEYVNWGIDFTHIGSYDTWLAYRFYDRTDGSIGVCKYLVDRTEFYNMVFEGDKVSLEPVTEDTPPPKEMDVCRDTVTLYAIEGSTSASISSQALPNSSSFVSSATIFLDMEKGTFVFGYDDRLTDLPGGTFTLTEKELVLSSNGSTYRYTRNPGNLFVFNSENSDEPPCFSYTDKNNTTYLYFYDGHFAWDFGR